MDLDSFYREFGQLKAEFFKFYPMLQELHEMWLAQQQEQVEPTDAEEDPNAAPPSPEPEPVSGRLAKSESAGKGELVSAAKSDKNTLPGEQDKVTTAPRIDKRERV